MNNTITKTFIAATLLGLSSVSAQAASIWLDPAGTSSVLPGDSISFDVIADASDITYTFFNPILGEDVTQFGFLAGAIDVLYNDSVLTYTGFLFNPDSGTVPTFTRVGDDCSVAFVQGCTQTGEINGISFGNFDGFAGTETLLITLFFEAKASGLMSVEVGDGDYPTVGWEGIDGVHATVDYDAPPAVPVPAAAWLMLSGLGLLGGLARRKAAV